MLDIASHLLFNKLVKSCAYVQCIIGAFSILLIVCSDALTIL